MAIGENHYEFSPAQPCKGKRCAMCSDGGVPETPEGHHQRLVDRYEKHDPTQHTSEEKAKAVAQFQQWADDDVDVKNKVNDIFNDRRPDGGG